MLDILAQIPRYALFRLFGHPGMMPLSITLSTTKRCNSRCKTCHIWEEPMGPQELSIEELDRIFKSLGKTPFWFTLSGGEPFLRKDLVDICRSIYANCKPGIINIPTNGLLYDIIPSMASRIAVSCPGTNIVINLSLDGVEEEHDHIRNVPGNWEKAMKTYSALRDLDHPNLEVGIHTVISRYNVDAVPSLYEYVMRELKPDSYITEIAEERVELGTIGTGITPSLGEYTTAIDFLSQKLKESKFSQVSKITQAFRLQYYNLVKQVLKEQRQIIPCYAGFASAQISSYGDVWMCCIKADPIGNLRDANYDFRNVWFSDKAKALRTRIKNKECYCPLANASYTNMLCHFPTLSKVGWRVLTS